MGRKKLNRTKDELNEQSNLRSKRYYKFNKQEICSKRMERYWKNKRSLQDN